PAAGQSGALFAADPSGDTFADLAFGPDGNLYVCSYNDAKILRFDGSSGALLGAFVTLGQKPCGLAFGPDGNLYVSTWLNAVLRSDGRPGAALPAAGQVGATFVPADGNAPVNPFGLAFGPDGNLYVATTDSNPGGANQVRRYNGQSGAFVDVYLALP